MKRIIEECARGFDSKVNPYEVVKLRLRGKGSGFKEGPNQEESEDPLNLCISSKYKDKFDYACREMEALLLKVYDEYYYFYLHKQRKPANWNKRLRIIKEESITQPKVYDFEEPQFEQKLPFQMDSFKPQAYQAPSFMPSYSSNQFVPFFPPSSASGFGQ